MLDFRRIEMSDFPALRKMYEKYGNWSCDCTICGTYMWRDYLDIRISLEEEKLIVYQQLDGKHLFYIPLMEDRIAGIREIVAYMKEQGEECYFYPVANEELPLFEEAGYRIETERDEGWNDYVYDITALANMKGKKYHNHKNHINKFNALYENVELLDIRDVEPAEYLQFLDDYVKSEHKKATIAKAENIKAKEVLSDLEAYGVVGYVLKVDGKIVGLEVGEILGDYYYSHIEKADKTYNGVYSKLVQLVSQDLQEKVKYMNREEDLNEPLKQSVKKRLPWLFALLLLGLLVSVVVGAFEKVVAQLTLIMAFQSLILDMSGNVGTQSLAVTIRVLMDENLTFRNKLRLVGKEMRVGFFNGLILGVLSFAMVGLYIMLFKHKTMLFSFAVSGCIGVSLILAMLISSAVGTLIPLFFKKIKVDPAVASGPLITTVNDLVAVVTYYGMSWILLLNVLKLV